MDDVEGLDLILRVLGVKYFCLGSGVSFSYVWADDRRLLARVDMVPRDCFVVSCYIVRRYSFLRRQLDCGINLRVDAIEDLRDVMCSGA